MQDEFIYGNLKRLDLHGYSREEALCELLYVVNMCDNNIDGIEIIHGYHGGRVLKDLVRKEFTSKRVEKMVFIDASRTIYKLKKE